MLKVDTEKQLHEVCGMVEDIGKMMHRTDNLLQQKVPVIDSLYINLSNLQSKTDQMCVNSSNEITALKQRQEQLAQLF